MIFKFLDYLNNKSINYKFLNGYSNLNVRCNSNTDHDILVKKSDFNNIDRWIKVFCLKHDFYMVQSFHQENYAKNIFLFNPINGDILNLDIYGEFSRKNIKFFEEDEVFQNENIYRGISILAPNQEFIYYLIKRIDKESLDMSQFDYLRCLYVKEKDLCKMHCQKFFKKHCDFIIEKFDNNEGKGLISNTESVKEDLRKVNGNRSLFKLKNVMRIAKRVFQPTGLTICFLGPDGSGKSTIINGLLNEPLPFRRKDYFHLKPLEKSIESKSHINSNPHNAEPYSKIVSYFKLAFFVFQYNVGWILNIYKLKIRSSLVIFDRYYDDLIVDHRRYKYSGSRVIADFLRRLIPKPEIYFVLTSDARIIYNRKKEVAFEELQNQIILYKNLVDDDRYFGIDVNKVPQEIILEVKNVLMKKLNARY
jgi:thymidylate kinase